MLKEYPTFFHYHLTFYENDIRIFLLYCGVVFLKMKGREEWQIFFLCLYLCWFLSRDWEEKDRRKVEERRKKLTKLTTFCRSSFPVVVFLCTFFFLFQIIIILIRTVLYRCSGHCFIEFSIAVFGCFLLNTDWVSK